MAAHRTDDRPLVAGRYARGERLGHGGFGVVWRAHDTLLQRDVAVKEIQFPAVLEPGEQAMLREKVLREARTAARLSHPGLVTVFDVVEEDGCPLIVMELVDAPTLSEHVIAHGPLSDAEAADVGCQVLDALGAAHAHGIVHRDVKPANVLIHESGRVQLADFGVASMLDDPKVTSSGHLAGSPAYMAPEQAEGNPATAATDLWGLGATLYYAVEGLPPFDRGSPIATLTAVVTEPHRPLRRAVTLAPLIENLLAKGPESRPPVEEVRRRLSDVANTAGTERDPTRELDLTDATVVEPAPVVAAPVHPPPLPPARPAPAPAPAPAVPTPAARQQRRPRPSRGRAPVALAIVLILGLLGGLVAALAARDDGDEVDTTTATTAASDAGGTAASNSPANWTSYRDAATGFAISHPAGWTVQRSGTLTDIRDPISRAYLRIDHQQPPGPSPEGAWLSLEPRFAADYPSYKRVEIKPVTFKGYKAATWEFTYSDGGADLHAVDLGFIAGNYGFALNFQTHAEDWNRMQSVFDQFKESFKAPT